MADSLKNAISFERVETDPCSYKVDFKLPADAVDKVFADALKEAGKHALIPGFRKGKAPAALVRARYGEYIAEDVEKQIQNVAFDWRKSIRKQGRTMRFPWKWNLPRKSKFLNTRALHWRSPPEKVSKTS